MILVDTSVWIDYLAGIKNLQTDWMFRTVGYQEIGLTDLILCEVLQGVRSDAAFGRVQRELSEFVIVSPANEVLAIASAQNYRFLRSRGHTVRKTIDCLIATYCITEGHALLHNDRDFDHFESFLGLQVVHPPNH